ncbi:MAG TPA: acyl-CoA dehydrogenase family protein, partial [Nevskiaceae bacterium]|nr:acyl-CoA dehydrogenase family protein [Nevskiaceae bacterium]
MDFNLNEDDRAFAESARTLFSGHCDDDALRAHDLSGAPYMQALWPACIEMGLHSVLLPESTGGMGLGMTALLGVLEAQGAALALVPLWQHQLAAAAIARFGTPALQAKLLPGSLQGSVMLTTSLNALADARGASLQLTRTAKGWQLDGHVAAVPYGDVAHSALLAAQGEDGPRLVVIELNQAKRQTGLDEHHLGVADVGFKNLALTADAVLAPDAHAWLEPRAIACLAALQLGVTGEQLRRTVQYVSARKQFDRPIGSFQLVAGGLADAKIALETLRSAVWQLFYRLDAGLGALPQALAVRAQACDLAHTAGHKAQHVHGGMGVDVSYPMHRFLYWSRALASELGGPEQHLARLGDWLAEHSELGWKYNLPEDSGTQTAAVRSEEHA